MKLLIFGATGQTGRLVLEKVLAAGHEVTVFVRDPAKIANGAVRVVTGDARMRQDVGNAVHGHDAIISTLGGTTPWKATGFEGAAMQNIIATMQDAGVRRVVAISMMGIGDSIAQAPFFYRYILMNSFVRGVTADKTAMERAMTASDADYTIVRAPLLKNAPATGAVKILGPADKGHQITRAGLAAFLLDCAVSGAHVRQAVTVVNR